MSIIKLSKSKYGIIAEGTYVFTIMEVSYDEDFGKISIDMKNENDEIFTQKYNLKTADDTPNEKSLSMFSFFAKTALNNFDLEEIDPEELVGHKLLATVSHKQVESNKTGKMLTFANLTDLAPYAQEESQSTNTSVDVMELLNKIKS